MVVLAVVGSKQMQSGGQQEQMLPPHELKTMRQTKGLASVLNAVSVLQQTGQVNKRQTDMYMQTNFSPSTFKIKKTEHCCGLMWEFSA